MIEKKKMADPIDLNHTYINKVLELDFIYAVFHREMSLWLIGFNIIQYGCQIVKQILHQIWNYDIKMLVYR